MSAQILSKEIRNCGCSFAFFPSTGVELLRVFAWACLMVVSLTLSLLPVLNDYFGGAS